MQVDLNTLIEITRKASKNLQRDFFELESLQSSEKGTVNFCNKACNRILDNLQYALSKYYKIIFYNNEDAKRNDFYGRAVLVEVLDGISNLERSLPYFAIMLTILNKKENDIITEKCIINFPALNEIYYAEKGKGAWLDRISSNFSGAMRLRTSGINKLEEIIVSSSAKLIDQAQKFSSNFRCFESYSYSIALLVSGKIDLTIYPVRDIATKGIELLISEAGGHYLVKDNMFIGSNFHISEKIKPLL